jgi:hypothetical protein
MLRSGSQLWKAAVVFPAAAAMSIRPGSGRAIGVHTFEVMP